MITTVCQNLINRNITIAVAESFTGGNIAANFVKFPGISKVFLCSTVAYSNEAKQKILGVSREILDKYGAVSSECAISMAECARRNINSDIAIATTGFAGPASEEDNYPVGTCFIAISTSKETYVRQYMFKGDRESITSMGVLSAFEFLNEIILKF